MNKILKKGFLCLFFITPLVHADSGWFSFTLDNDIFVGNDSGYSNGLYFTWIDVKQNEKTVEPSFLLQPLLWSVAADSNFAIVTSNTIGQAINTPEDIKEENPDENELPYSGLLFYNSTLLVINEQVADRIGTTVGVVGPSSGAEYVQQKFHSLTRSDDPKGWDTQLHDELVFQFTRARIWRYWVSQNRHFDLLLDSEASLGTLSSAVSTGFTYRYGRKLMQSYATHLLDSGRISNPVAVESGWYFYIGLKASHIFNQIFADGNSYRDSRSIEYNHDNIGVSLGYSHSWDDFSMTFAFNDGSIIESESEQQLKDLTRYGALTLAWKF